MSEQEFVYRDGAAFRKVFNGFFNQVLALSHNGKILLLYILANLGIDKEAVQVKRETVLEFMESTSDYMYKKAVRELIEREYIAKTESTDVFWINHDRMYNGNRVPILKRLAKENGAIV
jgi:hypothetical protein